MTEDEANKEMLAALYEAAARALDPDAFTADVRAANEAADAVAQTVG